MEQRELFYFAKTKTDEKFHKEYFKCSLFAILASHIIIMNLKNRGENPMMTFPIKKSINTELFIDKRATL